jgi:hypothetical protein
MGDQQKALAGLGLSDKKKPGKDKDKKQKEKKDKVVIMSDDIKRMINDILTELYQMKVEDFKDLESRV